MYSIDDPRMALFIEALEEGHTVDSARRAASLNWKLLYSMRRGLPDFAEAWNQAIGAGNRTRSKLKTITGDDLKNFLDGIASGKSVMESAKATSRHVCSFYKLRQRDEAFEKLWADAAEQGRRVHAEDQRRGPAAAFIRGLMAGMSVKDASVAAGKDIATFYRLKRKHSDFSREWDDAAMAFRRGQLPEAPPPPKPVGPEPRGTGGPSAAAPAGPRPKPVGLEPRGTGGPSAATPAGPRPKPVGPEPRGTGGPAAAPAGHRPEPVGPEPRGTGGPAAAPAGHRPEQAAGLEREGRAVPEPKGRGGASPGPSPRPSGLDLEGKGRASQNPPPRPSGLDLDGKGKAPAKTRANPPKPGPAGGGG
ncbi:MAG: hypothetical protein LBQ79_06055 [Deltaproteobacteria bacterium]|jgi:hypothetical protein|nr:hypothetical protein [Deltaproteobacteria bacterium]